MCLKNKQPLAQSSASPEFAAGLVPSATRTARARPALALPTLEQFIDHCRQNLAVYR